MVVYRKKRTQQYADVSGMEKLYPCHECGQMNDARMERCRFCGAQIRVTIRRPTRRDTRQVLAGRTAQRRDAAIKDVESEEEAL